MSKLLGATSLNSEDTKSALDSDMSEVLGLCSGVFPGTQTQGKAASYFGAEESVGSGGISSESEGEGEGNVVLSWAQRQKKLTTVFGRSGDPIEDEDMPTLVRKRKRVLPKPKPTKE